MQIHTACEKSVSICRTSGAICGLTNHPAWHLCCSARSVGEFSHVLFQAHRALSCLPQISQICTDAFHVQSAIDPCSSVAPGRIKDQAVGSGARVVIREKTHPCASVISVFFDKATRMASVLLCAICGRTIIPACSFDKITPHSIGVLCGRTERRGSMVREARSRPIRPYISA